MCVDIGVCVYRWGVGRCQRLKQWRENNAFLPVVSCCCCSQLHSPSFSFFVSKHPVDGLTGTRVRR